MTTPWIHLNPDLFPDPLTFNPQRFIDNPRLKRYIMAFSQGSRQCLGMQLAYAELYLVLAGVWRRFGSMNLESDMTAEEHAKHGIAAGIHCPSGRFELFETDSRDVEMEYDLFVPYGKKDSKGIRVVVK
jgi:Cytochrome P450